MPSPSRLLLGFLALSLLLLVGRAAARGEERPESRLARMGADGKLVYHPYNERGDRLPDFSWCGYKAGEVAIPDAPVKIALAPSEGEQDDQPRIQAALDQVAAMPLDANGLRGAVLLRRGTYHVPRQLSIRTSGVVLRGEGDGEDGTVMIASAPTKYYVVAIQGHGNAELLPDSRQEIVEDYVPVGARSFEVADGSGYAVGDTVMVCRVGNREWIDHIGMNRLSRGPSDKVKNWGPFELRFDRVVQSVDGNRITVDAPIANAIDAPWGGGYLVKYVYPGRIENVGVEHIRLESIYAHPTDHAHAWRFVGIFAAQNVWVRHCTAKHLAYAAVQISGNVKWATVRDVENLDMISRIKGGLRYPFALSGQLCLVERCYSTEGRHDFVMHARVPGPNAFVDCRADRSHSDSGPHHRYATGTLYDNVQTGRLNVQQRGRSGTGHGWAGAQMVFWNCRARSMDVQKPPTAQNLAIGCMVEHQRGNGYWESVNQPVRPRSLYLQQLADRLGPEAVTRATQSSVATAASQVHAECVEGEPVTITCPMVDGDRWPGPPRVEVVTEPKRGKVEVKGDRELVYHAPRGFAGEETFTWRAVDGFEISAPAKATVRVTAESEPPRLISAIALPGGKRVLARFSEPVDVTSGGNVSRFKVTGHEVRRVKVSGDPRELLLEVPSLDPGVQCRLTAHDVRDRAAVSNLGGGAAVITPLRPGIRYAFYEGAQHRFPDFDAMQPTSTGVTRGLAMVNPSGGDRFALQLTGWIAVAKAGSHTFELGSDDGSRLYIGETLVVDNGGLHAMRTRTGTVALDPGYHSIRIDYFDGGDAWALTTRWQRPGGEMQAIPSELLHCLPPQAAED